MDIDEFVKLKQPRAKRSKLQPFRAQILELKAKGFTNLQIGEWLASNNITVSQESVRKYIKNQQGKAVVKAVPLPSKGTVPSKTTPAPPVSKPTNPSDLREVRKKDIDLDEYL